MPATQFHAEATPAITPAETHPAVSVMIATYNRADTLVETLRHLEAQTWQRFEVFVVVDGSTDGTVEKLESYQKTSPFPLRFLVQPNGGLSRTRNTGVAHLRSPICLLIGDDIFPSSDFVRLHWEFHHAHPQLEAVAIGQTVWAEHGQTVTPFMRWLDAGQMQFSFPDLRAGVPPDWRHFYSSNLSLKTEYLRQNPSSEEFVSYGLEDIELGYRLFKRRNLSMTFLPDALAYHLHPNTFLKTCTRAVAIGAGSFTFGRLWPEHSSNPPKNPVKRILLNFFLKPKVLRLIRLCTDLITKMWCPNPLLRPVINLHSLLGYRETAAASMKAGSQT